MQYGVMPSTPAGKDGRGRAPSGSYGYIAGPAVPAQAGGGGTAPPGGGPPPSQDDEGPGLEWWERLGARMGRWRGLVVLRRIQVALMWPALAVVLVGLMISPLLRASMGAWFGAMWVVFAWFWMARLKTVSWRMISLVFAVGIPWSGVVAWISMSLAATAGVDVRSTSAEIVVASVVEELLKLAPLGLLGLLAPGRARRLLVVDWLVLGIAAGAAFMALEEMARRFAYLSGQAGLAGLIDRLLCSGAGPDQLECMGFSTFGPSPFSGAAEAALPYGGHAVVTGMVAVSIGLARHVWWRTGQVRAAALRSLVRGLCVLVPPWFLWVAMVDHMGRNASLESVAWFATDGQAPWLVVGVTSALTGGGQGRGWLLLVLLVVGAVLDARVLLRGGYSDSLYEDVGVYEGRPGGGALGAWRWRTLATMPSHAWGRWGADALDAVVLPMLEWRLVWRAAAVGRLLGRLSVPVSTTVGLRQTRAQAARTVLDPGPGGRWVTVAVAAACATGGLGVLSLVPDATRGLAERVGDPLDTDWLAGVLDLLGQVWDSMPLWQKALLLAFIMAALMLTGGSFWFALGYGLTFTSFMGAAHSWAGFVRDPAGTIRTYLATHTPAEIAMDIGLWVLEDLATRGLGRTVHRVSEYLDSPLLEAMVWGLHSRGLGRSGGVRDLDPVYAGADARRGATGQAGSRPSGRGRGSGASGSGRGGTGHGGAGHGGPGGSGSAGHSGGRGGSGNGGGRYGPAGAEDPDNGNHNNHGNRGRYDASREPDTQEDRSHQNSETSTGRYYNRDDKGHFTDGNGGSQDYELSEQAGMEELQRKLKKKDIGISREISSKHRASIEGVDHGRFYDRLVQLDDGRWIGLEVKSGSASLTPQQKAFDKLVSADNPAEVTLGDGTKISIVDVEVVEVPRQEFPPAQ